VLLGGFLFSKRKLRNKGHLCEVNEEKQKHGRSRVGRVINEQKRIVQWVKSAIHQDYFAIVFNYNVKLFQCRYKLDRHLFFCNMEVMCI
jgi:hypothetical protein